MPWAGVRRSSRFSRLRIPASGADQYLTMGRYCLLAGVILVVVAVAAAIVGEDAGGIARAIGSTGLAGTIIGAGLAGVRLHRSGVRASLPTSVARVQVRARPGRAISVATAALAVGLPLVAGGTLLVLVDWAWLVLAGVLLLGYAVVEVRRRQAAQEERQYALGSVKAEEMLERLCMRADMRPPEVIAEHSAVANCWTAGGRIHLTSSLLRQLDHAELEAVLAHEVAHLAHRDAAVMEICSAPSRVLLGVAATLARASSACLRSLGSGMPGADMVIALTLMSTALCAPPAFVIGWISRLSVLGMSRAREFSADAAAVTLTGRPSALASALLKLDREREGVARTDLREVEPLAVLCIVGTAAGRLGRLLSTHPSAAARIRRLETIEGRIQAAAGPDRLWQQQAAPGLTDPLAR
jgi:heat shock protein HtpX